MLPSPWNYIGLGVSVTLVLGIFIGVLLLIFKLGYRPLHKPVPLELPEPPKPLQLTHQKEETKEEDESPAPEATPAESKKDPSPSTAATS